MNRKIFAAVAACGLLTPQAFAVVRYNLIDLGTLPGFANSYATGINANGQVVGQSFNTVDFTGHGFLYSNGVMTDLGTLGGSASSADGINAAGQIAGYSTESSLVDFRPLVYNNGVPTDLGLFGKAYAINSSGQVAGMASSHAFIYTNGQTTDLGTFGGSSSQAYGINSVGQVVGTAETSGDLTTEAFVYSNGTKTDLGTFGGNASIAFGINSTGQVVGQASTTDNLATHAFLYANGTKTDLGTLGGPDSKAVAINTVGTVVGLAEVAPTVSHAFIYNNSGGMTDLNSLISPTAGWTLTSASGINDLGQIAAYGTAPDGSTRAVLLNIAVPLNWNINTSGSWDSATNWDLLVRPSSNLGAVIQPSATLTVTGPASPVALSSLSVGSSAGHVATLHTQAGGNLTVSSLTVLPTGKLSIDAATVTVSQSANVQSDIQLANGGVFTQNGGQSTVKSIAASGSLNVAAGKVTVAPGGTSASDVNSLQISPGSTLDLTNNDLVIDYTGSSPASTVRGYLVSGFNSGSWNGAGLASATAHADSSYRTAAGYAENSDLGYSTFDGQTVDSSSILVKYTYYGDSNLDGKVDASDFQRFIDGLTHGGSTWSQGDYTYDGHVDLGNDFDLFLTGFLGQGGSLGSLEGVVADSSGLTVSQRASLLAVIPEPTSLALFGLVFTATVTRRRRA